MPIYVDIDNTDPKDKHFDASKAGHAAPKAEAKMEAATKRVLEKAGFTTAKAANAKGYTIRLEVSKVEVEGRETKCSVKGSIVRYPAGVTKSRGTGEEMLSLGWGGNAHATGTDEGAIVDCVEAIAEDMMRKGVPKMNADFMKR